MENPVDKNSFHLLFIGINADVKYLSPESSLNENFKFVFSDSVPQAFSLLKNSGIDAVFIDCSICSKANVYSIRFCYPNIPIAVICRDDDSLSRSLAEDGVDDIIFEDQINEKDFGRAFRLLLKRKEIFDNKIHNLENSGRQVDELKDQKEIFNQVLAVVNQDITDQKKIEEELKTSLAEKEKLIKEIHHRVKNNLQIISSIFNLQLNFINNKSIEDIFQENQDRIRSIALVHEKLYKSRSLGEIDFSSYLSDLLNHLFSVYRDQKKIIRLEFDIEQVSVDIDTAINLGLAVNELIINALKHAFKNRDKGTLKVSLKHNSENKFSLKIKDDGIGLPKDFDLHNSGTLGMLLVDSMVNQLNGVLNTDSSEGTEVEIVFTA